MREQIHGGTLPIPHFDAAAVHLCAARSDALLIFSRLVAVKTAEGIGTAPEPVAAVQMSIGALKDLYLLIADQIDRHEKESGEIVTDYSLQREVARSGAQN